MLTKYRRKPLKVTVALLLIVSLFISMTSFISAAATGVPGVALLSHDQWAGDVDGNYDLNWTMWYGNNATTWSLYERAGAGEFVEVHSASIADNSPAVQSGMKLIRGKTIAGTYSYYVKLTNSFGSTNSNTVSVIVGSPTGDILLDGIDVTPTPVNQFTIAQTTVEIPIKFLASENPNFTVSTNNSTAVECSIVNNTTLKLKGLKGGRASLKLVETNTNETRYVGVRVKNSDGSLPGMPDYLSVGSVSEDTKADLDFWKDFGPGYTNKRMDVRYIYINGGPFNGWRSWTNVDGDRARGFIKESIKLGMIPFLVFYNIPDSGESYSSNLAHIQSREYMDGYYKDLKFLLEICREEAGDELVGLLFEPDFLGYLMQQSGKQPNEINADVAAAYNNGVLTASDPVFANNVEGLVKSINYTVNKYYPEAYFGWQFNLWAYEGPGVTSKGLLHATRNMGMTEGLNAIRAGAKATTEYYLSAGVASYGADFVSIDKYGLDGGAMPGAPANPADSVWFWNADIWTNYLEFVKGMKEHSNLPVILWQIPVGHINTSQQQNPYNGGLFPDLNGADTKYEDSAPVYFLGDTFKPGSQARLDYFKTNAHNDPKITSSGDTVTWGSHMQEAKDAGVVSVLFGAGVNSSTDGVGSPPSDDYWWITKAQRYYDNPVMLDGTTPIQTVTTPTFNPASGNYTSAQIVTLSCATEGATIRYTKDGTEPTASSPAYANAISVSTTTTLKAKAFKAGMNDSATATATYTFGSPIQTVATPTFNPASGTYTSAQSVTISCATADATIRYTTNGSEPTANSPVCDGAIAISSTTTLKAKAFKAGMNDSATATATYTINLSGGNDSGNPTGAPAMPQLAHNNWDGNASYTITFNIWWGNNATSYKLYENNTVIETGSLTGNSPSAQSKVFNIANKANGTYTYKIELTNSFGTTTSGVATVNVTKGSTNPIQTVATPTFNPASGSYTSAQSVTISTATAGATIRYTTNGTEPTASSSIYNGAITVSSTTTLKAKAFKAGMNDSATATATYTIGTNPIETVATPTFSLASGTYTSAQSVTITCTTANAVIRYTTNGSEPTASSPVYDGAITVSTTTTLKAKAFKAGMNDSATATATYTIDTGNQPAPWAPYTAYKQGDVVSYNGKSYVCRQPHTALPGWDPANVPALWTLA